MLHERVDASPQTATLGHRSLRYASSSYLVSMDCLVYGTSENMRQASAEDISRPVAGARIAVVDDEPSVTRFLSRLLSIHGYYVLAEDPVRILRAAKFAARFASRGFSIAPETRDLMRQMVDAGEVDALVPDRVWKETEAALAGPSLGALASSLVETAPLETTP